MFFKQHLDKKNYYNELNERCKKIVLSDRAYAMIIAEAYQRINTETGGLLLGHYDNGIWYVVEVIDPGIKASYSTVEFEYDGEYVTHLLKKIARIYKYELHFLGAWHRHPGSMDTFSNTDDMAHKNIVKWVGNGAISLLINFDPDFRITSYYVDENINYWKVREVLVGNRYCDPKVLELRAAFDSKKKIDNRYDVSKNCLVEEEKAGQKLLDEFKKRYFDEIQNNIEYYSSAICRKGDSANNAIRETTHSIKVNLFDQTRENLLSRGYQICMKISSPKGFTPLIINMPTMVLNFNESNNITVQLELIKDSRSILDSQCFIESILEIEALNIYLKNIHTNKITLQTHLLKR